MLLIPSATSMMVVLGTSTLYVILNFRMQSLLRTSMPHRYNLQGHHFQPYFCGQDLECTKHNSRWALQRAMESVDRHYPVVGVLEELDKSLFVMQSLVPKFFRGISDLFGNGNASELNC